MEVANAKKLKAQEVFCIETVGSLTHEQISTVGYSDALVTESYNRAHSHPGELWLRNGYLWSSVCVCVYPCTETMKTKAVLKSSAFGRSKIVLVPPCLG